MKAVQKAMTIEIALKKVVGNMEALEMTEKELMQKNVEEFERLQDYMISCEKESDAYKKMVLVSKWVGKVI